MNGDQFKSSKESTRRLLLAEEGLEELEFNIENHLNFILISKVETNYTVDLKNLTYNKMEILFTFEKPLEISNVGFTDIV